MLLGKTIVVTGIASGIGARIGELAVALGADVIGVDVKPPATPIGAFIQADLSSAAAIEALAESLPGRFDALCNVAGVSGVGGAAKTLAINFYGLRALSEARRAAPSRRRRGRQRRLDRRLRLAREPRTRQGDGRRARFSRHRRAARRAQGRRRRRLPAVERALAAVDDAGGAPAAVQAARHARQRRQPRAGDDADPERVPRRVRRRRASTTTSPASDAPARRPTSRRRRCSSVPTARAGSTAPTCPSTAGWRRPQREALGF